MGLPIIKTYMVQWLRLCLTMQGTPVQSQIRELRSHVLRGS